MYPPLEPKTAIAQHVAVVIILGAGFRLDPQSATKTMGPAAIFIAVRIMEVAPLSYLIICNAVGLAAADAASLPTQVGFSNRRMKVDVSTIVSFVDTADLTTRLVH